MRALSKLLAVCRLSIRCWAVGWGGDAVQPPLAHPAKFCAGLYIWNKKTIEKAYEAEAFACGRKRLRPAKHPGLKKAVMMWIKDMRSQSLSLGSPIIMVKAADFAMHFNNQDFVASEGWFHRFRKRHDLAFRSVSGKSKDMNMGTCMMWQSGVLQDYLNSYSPCDIFNADKTTLFFNLLPDKTISYMGDNCAGGKRNKEHVTVMVTANMVGVGKPRKKAEDDNRYFCFVKF